MRQFCIVSSSVSIVTLPNNHKRQFHAAFLLVMLFLFLSFNSSCVRAYFVCGDGFLYFFFRYCSCCVLFSFIVSFILLPPLCLCGVWKHRKITAIESKSRMLCSQSMCDIEAAATPPPPVKSTLERVEQKEGDRMRNRKSKRGRKKLPNWLFYGVKLPIQAIWYSNWVNVVNMCISLFIFMLLVTAAEHCHKKIVSHLRMLRFAHVHGFSLGFASVPSLLFVHTSPWR